MALRSPPIGVRNWPLTPKKSYSPGGTVTSSENSNSSRRLSISQKGKAAAEARFSVEFPAGADLGRLDRRILVAENDKSLSEDVMRLQPRLFPRDLAVEDAVPGRPIIFPHLEAQSGIVVRPGAGQAETETKPLLCSAFVADPESGRVERGWVVFFPVLE